jgi:hypothetical protein
MLVKVLVGTGVRFKVLMTVAMGITVFWDEMH